MSTVCVCDDSPLSRETLRRMVSTVPGVTRVTVAASGEELLSRYDNERPALVLMDVRMPGIGGLEATRRLLANHPDAMVLMITAFEDPEGVARAVSAGARGYVHRDAGRVDLAAAVATALADATREAFGRSSDDVSPHLTERELQVLAGMARGRSNNQIGRELYLSEDTIKTHARRLFRKLEAADRAQAVAVGLRTGLVR